MPQGRGGIAELLTPDLRSVYIDTGKERPLEHPMIVNKDVMPWNPITDQQVSGLGTMPEKAEGGAFTPDQFLIGGRKTYEAMPFGMAVEYTFEAWRDELYGILREIVAEMKRASNNRLEVSGFAALNRAFNTAYTGFTAGESLCSTAHIGLDGASRANRPSPDVAFSNTGLQSAVLRYENMTDERGLPRLLAPTKVLITAQNKFKAREILGSSRVPYKADNEINAIIDEDLSWMVVHYFTTNAQWFLCTNPGIHDVNMFMRDEPMFDSFDDQWTKNAVFTSYQRHTESSFGAWRGIDGSTGV